MSDSDAEVASRRALDRVYKALDEGRSFKLEAGAGAGKTWSLTKVLERLIEQRQAELVRRGRRIACITYTNVARDEIEARVDRHPVVQCNTIHGFCWSLLHRFQQPLRESVASMDAWQDRLEAIADLSGHTIEYKLGFRSIDESVLSLHHDDILPLMVALMAKEKFRRLITHRYPIILIDEYQDSHAGWVRAIEEHFLDAPEAPQFGFFGDHWQKIYGNGCGEINHPAVESIDKEANFRSAQIVVDVLNRMRPSLPQFAVDPDSSVGALQVFHTNEWSGERRVGQHWKGDLPPDVAHEALARTRKHLGSQGWDFATTGCTKVLMLTHRGLAAEQGYPSLPNVFKYTGSYTSKEHPYIAYFVEVLEPACKAYANRLYGRMFDALGPDRPAPNKPADKVAWTRSMDKLLALRNTGTVGDVLDHLGSTQRPRLPVSVAKRERDRIALAADEDAEKSKRHEELIKLREVPYREIVTLLTYLDGTVPFATKHGVKGAEFENVLVVIGRGWNQYNFDQMLELSSQSPIPSSKQAAYERNRNLFYVACSRARTRLAILFTQELSATSVETLTQWFGVDAIESLSL